MSNDTRQLTALLQRKHECLSQVRDVGVRQLEMIAHGEMTMLMKVLSAKQRLLDQLNQVERALDPFRSQSPDERTWSTPAEREQCQRLSSHCQLLFAEIVEQERTSESQLILQRDDAERRLRGMHVVSQAHGAYAFESAAVTGLVDLTTES